LHKPHLTKLLVTIWCRDYLMVTNGMNHYFCQMDF
jgi:hypothetical protein